MGIPVGIPVGIMQAYTVGIRITGTTITITITITTITTTGMHMVEATPFLHSRIYEESSHGSIGRMLKRLYAFDFNLFCVW